MSTLATGLTLIVAVLHFLFMALESVLWTRPLGRKVFGNTPEKAEETRLLAANQGIYNGCLGAALIWSVAAGDVAAQVVLLAFVTVVGIYGAATVSRQILFIQALPAIAAVVLVLLS